MNDTLPMQRPLFRAITVCAGAIALALALTGCGRESPNDDFGVAEEQRLLAQYAAGTGSLGGIVIDEAGLPVGSATLEVSGQSVQTDASGHFDFTTLPAGNHLLGVGHPSHAAMTVPVAVTAGTTRTLTLQLADTATTRLFFGGDTSFGRRFLDPLLATMGSIIPPDNPGAWIQASTAGDDAVALTTFIRELSAGADFSVINFESPVLDSPSTPHPVKDYVFFSLPDTLQALDALGIDYVSLGNNHVYDYLEQGNADTIANMQAAGIPFSGIGPDLESALQSYVTTIKGRSYALFSATSITGEKHTTPADPYSLLYVATSTAGPGTKGGAADLTAGAAVSAEIQQQVLAGNFVIAQLHGGDEYTYAPTPYILSAIDRVTQDGAGLVVGHHPHVAQGFAVRNGKPVILGLGNFLFDQDRQETMLGLAVIVEIASDNVQRVLAYPVYLEDYRPRLVTGELADRLLKRLAEFSDDNVTLIPQQGHAEVYFQANAGTVEQQTVAHTVVVPASGTAIIDLRALAGSDRYLSAVSGVPASSLELGRDLMLHGDFEDHDVDDQQLEASRWDLTGSSVYTCLARAHRGVQGVCSERNASQSSASVLPYRNTIRLNDYTGSFYDDNIRLVDQGYIAANRDIGLFGYATGENAGGFVTRVYYTSSEESLDYGSEDLATVAAGTYGWRAFYRPLHMPPPGAALEPELPPAAVRLRLLHQPPASGYGRLALDDMALVSWDRRLALASGQAGNLRPHASEFLRLTATPGTYTITLQFSRRTRA